MMELLFSNFPMCFTTCEHVLHKVLIVLQTTGKTALLAKLCKNIIYKLHRTALKKKSLL